MINKRRIAPELKGLIDKASVSLNTDNEDLYDKFCHPEFGPGTYKRIIDFIGDLVKAGIDVEVTCLDLPGVNMKKCEEIAGKLGASFRLRKVGVTG